MTTSFVDVPVVLSQVQTENVPSFVKTRQQGIASGEFQVALEGEEDDAGDRNSFETIGYLAIQSGIGSVGGIEFEASTTAAIFNDTGVTLDFSDTFDSIPGLIASITTYNGADHSSLRYDLLTESGVRLYVEEDTTSDTETVHGSLESVSYLAFAGSGSFIGQTQL